MVSGRALAFLLVLVLANFFGCTVLLIPLYLLLAVSLTLYRRWADYVLAAWFHLSPVNCAYTTYTCVSLPCYFPYLEI